MKRNPDRTRAAILAAARAEFAEFGPDGARVDRIAARAGANKRMLYHYVGNKEALYARVLADACRGLAGVCHGLADVTAARGAGDATPSQALADLVGLMIDHAQRNPWLARLLTAEAMQRGGTLATRPDLRGVAVPLVDTLARILAAGAADDSLAPGADARELALSILALATFPLMPALAPLLEAELESAAAVERRRAHLIGLVLAALRP